MQEPTNTRGWEFLFWPLFPRSVQFNWSSHLAQGNHKIQYCPPDSWFARPGSNTQPVCRNHKNPNYILLIITWEACDPGFVVTPVLACIPRHWIMHQDNVSMMKSWQVNNNPHNAGMILLFGAFLVEIWGSGSSLRCRKYMPWGKNLETTGPYVWKLSYRAAGLQNGKFDIVDDIGAMLLHKRNRLTG